MALSDILLKAKVNMALVRDPRVGVLDIGVHAANGVVELVGDVDNQEECAAAEQIARKVEGVTSVKNSLSCGMGKGADTVDLVTQRLLEKLDEQWNNLPDKSALNQADYLRWALWMTYKFRIPAHISVEAREKLEHGVMEQAIARIAGHVGAPKAIIALEMLRQAEQVAQSSNQNAPQIDNPNLISTPIEDKPHSVLSEEHAGRP